MSWIRSHRRVRLAAVGVGLLLFLAGTHYCLVGAIAASSNGSPMACLAMLPDGSSDAPASHCGHAPKADSGPPGSPPASLPPCCIAITPIVAPQSPEPAAWDGGPELLPIAEGDALPALPVVRLSHSTATSHPPRSLLESAPFSGRAPPLA